MYDLFYMYMCMNGYIFNNGCAGGETPRTFFLAIPFFQFSVSEDGHLAVRGRDVTDYWFLPIFGIIDCDIRLVWERPTSQRC